MEKEYFLLEIIILTFQKEYYPGYLFIYVEGLLLFNHEVMSDFLQPSGP